MGITRKLTQKNNGLLEQPNQMYTKEFINLVFKYLDEGLDHHKIAELTNESTHQIKLFRFIKNKGNTDDIALLYECKYFPSRIKYRIQMRKKKEKVFDKKFNPDFNVLVKNNRQ